MRTSAVGIVFSNLNNNTLSKLTSDRTVAAIPFGCRYRLIDFCLSNLVNANVTHINIIANYNYRSLLEHIGSGKDWDLARRVGGINVISPYQTSRTPNAKLYSHHMEALKNMKEYISEFKEDTVILMDSDSVLNINLAEVIAAHEKSAADITFVTKAVAPDYTAKHSQLMVSSVAGKIADMALADGYSERTPDLSLNIFVMKTDYLRKLISDAEAAGIESLTEMMLRNYKYANYRTYAFGGYVASVSSFLDYFRCTIDLAKNSKAREELLWKKDAPIFTKVHNSIPTVYHPGAEVADSMIADDCEIEGMVINSVLFRGVKVARGAVVSNCVLFRGTLVGEGAKLNCIVADKDVQITDGVTLSGHENMPFYIQKNRKV